VVGGAADVVVVVGAALGSTGAAAGFGTKGVVIGVGGGAVAGGTVAVIGGRSTAVTVGCPCKAACFFSELRTDLMSNAIAKSTTMPTAGTVTFFAQPFDAEEVSNERFVPRTSRSEPSEEIGAGRIDELTSNPCFLRGIEVGGMRARSPVIDSAPSMNGVSA